MVLIPVVVGFYCYSLSPACLPPYQNVRNLLHSSERSGFMSREKGVSTNETVILLTGTLLTLMTVNSSHDNGRVPQAVVIMRRVFLNE